MPSFAAASHRVLSLLPDADRDWIHQLIADWQVIADMSVSDLVLWVRSETGRFVAVAHQRPSTGSTVHLEEVIGHRMPASREVLAIEALTSGQPLVDATPLWTGSYAVREEYVPVVRDGTAIAVMTRETSVGLMRGGRHMETILGERADRLCQMVAEGASQVLTERFEAYKRKQQEEKQG